MHEYKGIENMEGFFKIVSQDNRPEHNSSGFSVAAVRISEITQLLSLPTMLLRRTAPWRILQGKQILDIGCGSAEAGIVPFPAHFASLLAKQGAEVYGIDKGKQDDNDEGVYTHIQTNIVDQVMKGAFGQIPKLKGKQFDIVNASNFVGTNPSPTLMNELDSRGSSVDQFSNELIIQLSPLVKEGGYILFDSIRYQKLNGQIMRIPDSR